MNSWRFVQLLGIAVVAGVAIGTLVKGSRLNSKGELPSPPKIELDQSTRTVAITALIDPSKLATLGDRGANKRLQKIVAILALAQTEGVDPSVEVEKAVNQIGWGGSLKGKMTAVAILRNLEIARAFGCTDQEGVELMRRGKAPLITRGEYRGEILSVDHIIPRSLIPELDNVFANLELLPLPVNLKKSDAVGSRQVELGRDLVEAGLLSVSAFSRLQAADAAKSPFRSR